MARDFIYIDSDKVKDTLKTALEMGEGDMSGNKLGLSSKIVPTVCLNNYPKLMTSVVLNVTAVQNTWYTVAVMKNVELWCASIQMNTLAEDIEARLTIDGVDFTFAQAAAVAGTVYNLYFENDDTGIYLAGAATPQATILRYCPHSFREVIYAVRKTTAGAANSLHASCTYAQW